MTDVTSAIGDVVTTVTAGVTVGNIAALIAIALGVGFGFVLLWFGMRKVMKIFLGALKSGKLKI